MKVYIIESMDGYVKIGFSKDPMTRLHQLQTGHATKLELIKTYPFASKREASEFEKKCHYSLQDYGSHGEWFTVETNVAVRIIDELFNPALAEKSIHSTMQDLTKQLDENVAEGDRLRDEMTRLKGQLDIVSQAYWDNITEFTSISEQIQYCNIRLKNNPC